MISSLDWPASVISGGNLDKDFADSQEPGGLLMEAEREGVVALVYARLLLADETAGSRRDRP